MLAYAPRSNARSGSPRTLLLVAAGHAAALALLLTARSHYEARTPFDPTDVVFVPTKTPPPPPPPPPSADSAPQRPSPPSALDRPTVIVPTPTPDAEPIAPGPSVTTIDPIIADGPGPGPAVTADPPRPAPIRRAARFVTPADRVRPPYPLSKQQLEQSASLRLTLAIDANGRVTAVTPVGSTDPVFLDAARRHILRHWRYAPATEGDVAVASSVTITLRFELEE